ncbi:MAG: hypothetical protein ACOC2Q_00680 [Spirochaetota bacterium]
MRLIHRAALLAAAIIVLPGSPASVAAQVPDVPILVIELWSELDPIVADGGERPIPREVAIERLLDEAVFVLSGMIYGFRFVYAPSDPTRRVAEQFELDPYAEIVRGDPRLEVLQTWVEESRLYARIFYTLDEQQAGWYRGWTSAANASASGTGKSPFIAGPGAKPGATRDAIRMAIRNHARGLEFNRPRRISGAVLVADAPRSVVRDGNYETRIAVLLQIDSITRYENY